MNVLSNQISPQKVDKDAIELVQKILDLPLLGQSTAKEVNSTFEKTPILTNSLSFLWQCLDDKSSVGIDQ